MSGQEMDDPSTLTRVLGGPLLTEAALELAVQLRHETEAGWEIDHVTSCGWIYKSPCPRCYPDH